MLVNAVRGVQVQGNVQPLGLAPPQEAGGVLEVPWVPRVPRPAVLVPYVRQWKGGGGVACGAKGWGGATGSGGACSEPCVVCAGRGVRRSRGG